MNRLPPPFPRFLREGGVRYFGTELLLTLSLQTTGMEHRAHLARIVSCRHVGKTNTLREDSRRHHQSYRWAFYWQEASRMDCSGLAHRDLIAVAERNGDGMGISERTFPITVHPHWNGNICPRPFCLGYAGCSTNSQIQHFGEAGRAN